MSGSLLITRAGPLTTIQDAGRFGMLAHGISASGPMDRAAYDLAGRLAMAPPGTIEITTAGLDFRVETGPCVLGFAGGAFTVRHNGSLFEWPGKLALKSGDTISVSPGPSGNYGYLRFDGRIDVPAIMGSIATNSRARLGGLEGRVLAAGDRLRLIDGFAPELSPAPAGIVEGPIRVVWGLHADLFPTVRDRFVSTPFKISSRLDRMGVRLEDPAGVFASSTILSLVSDAVLPGDIQILGDGTPIVLMRDHQPTGGYPRIATIITADLDRFAQMRPGSAVAFASVSVDHAHHLLRGQP
ncbi:MAG: biotin-dependent carboxyltransferase family protein [Devosia sp.]|uniref:5-oxoprolinase subunit C family protein n=1 Tax=Devosia sp. TaxID=1871048 RepID=UPI002621708A|nr:biotin-dependent carboxyltransferase family protein [Devosia sp.]MDB5529227.1 biotin-dependent carboxyltransferase family protein [Devosia sp.]